MDTDASPVRPRRRRGRRSAGAAIVALLAALIAAGCGGSSGQRAQNPVVNLNDVSAAPGLRGTALATPLRKPDLTLVDTAGRPYDLRTATAGRLALVYLGYTHCPDVCPTTIADLAAALSQTSAAVRRQVTVVFVTTDPDRDTSAVLRDWLAQFDPTFVGLRGSWDQVASYAQYLGISLEPPKQQADGTWIVGHGSQVTAFEPNGVASTVYLAGVTPADYAHDIPLLLAGAR